ncbi:alpha/beta hydrolase [Lujinxingia litoralis]|uniref:Alpha/beta hydrolase n=2 Tax=Lujinxingia litoralis TaxID=2211119 RepID=A0A328C7U1_9DELT|nr:alpha/beta hydrolase [Lujinxingia litoralis]
MVHGNPTWSFYYRNLIEALRGEYRTIAPDHIGCGRSDKPGDASYAYTLERRVEDLESLVASLKLEGPLTLVLHDWGGMIGMSFAVRNPHLVGRIVLLNTGAFSLPQTKKFPLPLKVARDSGVGAALVERLNAFSRTASRVCVTSPLSAEVRRAYEAPYDTPEHRIATLRFVQDIPLGPGDRAWELVKSTESRLGELVDRPIFIGWGYKDFVFDRHFLARWKEIYPQATYVEYPEAGHYVLEDRRKDLIPKIVEFIGSTDAWESK